MPPRWRPEFCTFDGCDGEHGAFGLCQRHYLRMKRGQPLDEDRSRGEGHKWARLTADKVRQLRKLRDAEGLSFSQLGEMFGVHTMTAFNAYHRNTWAHVD